MHMKAPECEREWLARCLKVRQALPEVAISQGGMTERVLPARTRAMALQLCPFPYSCVSHQITTMAWPSFLLLFVKSLYTLDDLKHSIFALRSRI